MMCKMIKKIFTTEVNDAQITTGKKLILPLKNVIVKHDVMKT